MFRYKKTLLPRRVFNTDILLMFLLYRCPPRLARRCGKGELKKEKKTKIAVGTTIPFDLHKLG